MKDESPYGRALNLNEEEWENTSANLDIGCISFAAIAWIKSKLEPITNVSNYANIYNLCKIRTRFSIKVVFVYVYMTYAKK